MAYKKFRLLILGTILISLSVIVIVYSEVLKSEGKINTERFDYPLLLAILFGTLGLISIIKSFSK